jgi:hypothetical protein
MIEDSVKQTRIEIVASGLALLLANAKETISRKQFFLLDSKFIQTGDYKKIQQVAKANASKSWHSGVLERLIADGLIKKIGDNTSVTYQVANIDKVANAFQNFKSGDKLIVSHYVFPNEVQLDRGEINRSKLIEPEEAVAVTTSSGGEVEIDMATLLKNILENLIFIKKDHIDYRSQFDKFEGGALGLVSAISNAITANSETNSENAKILQTVINKTNGNTKSIDELGTQIKNQHLLLEAGQRTNKELLASIQGITNISQVVDVAKASLQQITIIAAKVESLTNEIKAKEANKLSALADRMKNKLNDLAALQDEILTTVANFDGDKNGS